MAKFFRTYRYNPLCQWIGAEPARTWLCGLGIGCAGRRAGLGVLASIGGKDGGGGTCGTWRDENEQGIMGDDDGMMTG
eukprot:2919520-Rhodomonas_salina.1